MVPKQDFIELALGTRNGHTSSMTTPSKRKQRIVREQVKDQHTSHWDLDMLSYAELEQLMRQQENDGAAEADTVSDAEQSDDSRQ